LFDVHDVEDLCTRHATMWRKRSRTRLAAHEIEELVSFLISETWKMSRTYDRSRSSSFEAVVRLRLPNRCVDWMRLKYGRTVWQFRDREHRREVNRPVELDCVDGGRGDGVAGDVHDGWGQVGASVEQGYGDPAAGGGADLFGGLLDRRDREADRDLAIVREAAARIVRERTADDRAA
jgi:hypothetical protein